MDLELKYRITFDDRVAQARYYISRTPSMWRVFVWDVILIVGLYLCVVYFVMRWIDYGGDKTTLLVVTGIVGAIVRRLSMRYRLPRILARKAMRQEAGLPPEPQRTMILSAEGIHLLTENSDSLHGWNGVTHVQADPDHIFLTIEGRMHAIPRRDLGDELFAEAGRQLQEWRREAEA